MRDIELLIRLQAQVAVFLAELPTDRLVALAEGRASLALVDAAGDQMSVSTATATPSALLGQRPPAAPAVRLPTARSRATPRPRMETKASRVDVDNVIAQLRASETVDEATSRLAAFNLRVNDLKEIAQTLNIPTGGRKDDLAKRILTLIVGARSKHAALRRG